MDVGKVVNWAKTHPLVIAGVIGAGLLVILFLRSRSSGGSGLTASVAPTSSGGAGTSGTAVTGDGGGGASNGQGGNGASPGPPPKSAQSTGTPSPDVTFNTAAINPPDYVLPGSSAADLYTGPVPTGDIATSTVNAFQQGAGANSVTGNTPLLNYVPAESGVPAGAYNVAQLPDGSYRYQTSAGVGYTVPAGASANPGALQALGFS